MWKIKTFFCRCMIQYIFNTIVSRNWWTFAKKRDSIESCKSIVTVFPSNKDCSLFFEVLYCWGIWDFECISCFKELIYHIPYFKRPESFMIGIKTMRTKREKVHVFVYSHLQKKYISKINTFYVFLSTFNQSREKRRWIDLKESFIFQNENIIYVISECF